MNFVSTQSTSGGRRYFSERHGRGRTATLTPAQARRLFSGMPAERLQNGELQQAVGYECVDEGEVFGTLGSAVGERLLLELGRDDLWPVGAHANGWDDDTLFDMMEFIYDQVSSPIEDSGRYHSFGNCGWHYAGFEREPARAEYRRQANEILHRMELAYEMTTDGEIIHRVPDGVVPLLDSAPRKLPATQKQIVEAAVTKYRSRSSTATDRRDAVRDLADVLVNLRFQVKEVLPKADEAMLFETANKFWIRHNKPGEYRNYDHDAWWSWLFYVYLASIALVTHIVDREEAD